MDINKFIREQNLVKRVNNLLDTMPHTLVPSWSKGLEMSPRVTLAIGGRDDGTLAIIVIGSNVTVYFRGVDLGLSPRTFHGLTSPAEMEYVQELRLNEEYTGGELTLFSGVGPVTLAACESALNGKPIKSPSSFTRTAPNSATGLSPLEETFCYTVAARKILYDKGLLSKPIRGSKDFK